MERDFLAPRTNYKIQALRKFLKERPGTFGDLEQDLPQNHRRDEHSLEWMKDLGYHKLRMLDHELRWRTETILIETKKMIEDVLPKLGENSLAQLLPVGAAALVKSFVAGQCTRCSRKKKQRS